MQKQAKIPSKGQITVPGEVRRILGVRPGDLLLFESDGKGIRVWPVRSKSTSRSTAASEIRRSGLADEAFVDGCAGCGDNDDRGTSIPMLLSHCGTKIRPEHGGTPVPSRRNEWVGSEEPNDPKLVFTRSGGRVFLSEVWEPGKQAGLPASESQRPDANSKESENGKVTLLASADRRSTAVAKLDSGPNRLRFAKPRFCYKLLRAGLPGRGDFSIGSAESEAQNPFARHELSVGLSRSRVGFDPGW